MVESLPAVWETWVQSLGREDPLEKEMAAQSSIIAWIVPWTEEPGRLQSMGSQSQTWLSDFTFFSFSFDSHVSHMSPSPATEVLFHLWLPKSMSSGTASWVTWSSFAHSEYVLKSMSVRVLQVQTHRCYRLSPFQKQGIFHWLLSANPPYSIYWIHWT